MEWTPSQQDAVSARRGTVLVAAAAGSGKTAVLVQRAIQRLTNPERPTRADRLLIVTFTKAAAGEMRARLELQLYQLLRENPGNQLLRRQSVRLHQAHIGTVDSFCAEMAREFFHLLGISPEFKILSDKREEELTAQALEEVMAQAFQSGRATALADAFTGERDDRRLMGMVLTLYRFMQSHPFPEKWLEEKVAMYFHAGPQVTPWEKVVLDYAGEAAGYCAQLLERAQNLAQEDAQLFAAFSPALSADREACLAIAQAARAGDWDLARAARQAFAPKRRGALKGWDKEDPLLLRLEACRKEVKAVVEGLGKSLSASRESCAKELEAAGPLLESLAGLTMDFSRRYQEKKREKNFLDYSDLEHCAIRLFCREDGSPTAAAQEVASRFDEIMIDEYQDINEVQDSIFRAISQKGENLFMVGDVKQSIYGFRRAMPEIFLRCRSGYQKYSRNLDQYPAYIVLDRNFRSRREVTDGVNFVFSRLMSREAGDIDYTGEERLAYGAGYQEKPGCETEMVFLTREAVPPEIAEAGYIAGRVKEMLAQGFTVEGENGPRPARYGDFCILLRSANKYAHMYAQELKRLGVPARATVSGGFFSAAEIQVMLSLLRVIDNPNQDIPLLAVLMSPLYGFSADDTARLRGEDKEVSLYVSLTRGAERDPRCRRVWEEITRLRSLAATMPADTFLTMLYGRTGYGDMVLAMEDGAARLENLRLLRRYAQEYESSGYHGLSGFVRFLDRLREGGGDMQAAQVQPGGSDGVSIMSIHKSKGLQFPVCIVAGCGRNFTGDLAEDVLLHPDLGLGVKLKDPQGPARYTTTAREAIALETARAARAEELRVLYVAMTRPKEKLILVASMKSAPRRLQRLAALAHYPVPAETVAAAGSMAEWLLLPLLRRPEAAALLDLAGIDVPPLATKDRPWQVVCRELGEEGVLQQPEEAGPEAEEAVWEPDFDPALLLHRYPFQAAETLQTKVTATELKGRPLDREIAEETVPPPKTGLWPRPRFVRQEAAVTAAERGTYTHLALQYLDLDARDVRSAVAEMVERGCLTAEQAAGVDRRGLGRFLASDLAAALRQAKRVEREYRFSLLVPAKDYLGEAAGEDEILLQGVVDCFFETEQGLTVVDFKTDYVTAETIQERSEGYRPQLTAYSAALARIFQKPVVRQVLYFLSMGREVEL